MKEGLPRRSGLYWVNIKEKFPISIAKEGMVKSKNNLFLAQVPELGITYLFNESCGKPIFYYYDYHSKYIEHIEISKPKEWYIAKYLNNTPGWFWIKNKQGNIGIYIRENINKSGIIVWANHPTCSSEHKVDYDPNMFECCALLLRPEI